MRTNGLRCAAVISLSISLLLVTAPRPAAAQVMPWQTAPGVGPNEVVYTLDLICTTGGLVCDALDDYVDQQTAQLDGSGTIDFDVAGGTAQFLQDGTIDLMDGQGVRNTYMSTSATDLLFAEIPFVGAPQTEGGVLLALTNPLLDAGEPLAEGMSYPISAVVSYTALADIVGPVDAYLPELVLPPSDVTMNGTLVIQAVFGSAVYYQLRDLTATLEVQNQTTLLGEDVTVSVTADMTLNLRGLVADQTPSILPALGPLGLFALAGALATVGVAVGRPSTQRSAQRIAASEDGT